MGFKNNEYERLSYTFSLITQNSYKFFSLTIPSDIIGDTCFVTSRYDNPLEGFQRRLDEKRAIEIGEYIDSGFGTIPSAVVLSAQPEADLVVKPGGRALTFCRHPKAFLVIDGQHRVWGYRKAKSHLRVPVIVYQKLTRQEETRLFIDINTKQRPVPNELLLDIKHLANLETDGETFLRELFNVFHTSPNSILKGLLSPYEKTMGKISRTTFNAAFSSLSGIFLGKSVEEVFSIFNAYFSAFQAGLADITYFLSPNIFKAIVAFFPDVASKVKDRFDGEYTTDNFLDVLQPVFRGVTKPKLMQTKRSYRELQEYFKTALNKNFSL